MNKQKEKVPDLRFKGFTDDWEQRKFSEILAKSDGLRRGPFGSALKKEFFISSSEYTVYEQNNAIYNTWKTRYFITPEKFQELHKFQLMPGDFILSGAGTIGRIAQVPANITKGVFNQALIRIRINPEWMDKKFFLIWMQSENMQRKLTQANPGSAMTNLVPMSEIKKWEIIIPSKAEQNKIGEFIQKLNSFITLHQRKLDLLNQLKKGLLQKMFADKGSKRPILRFEGFTGNWEIRQLKELGEIITGNTPKTSQVENYSSNGIPWVTPTDINSVYTTDSAKRLSTVGKDKAKIAPANSLLVTCIASIGKNTLVLQESAFNQQINALIPVKNDPFFLLAESAKWSRIMRNLAGQTSMQIINKKTFSGISTSIPDLKEQKIIGSLFKKLDNTIAFQQQRISRVNEIKKSLLQQMFI